MSYPNPFPIIEYNEASSEVREIYDETMELLGTPQVLNWFKCQGSNYPLLKANWEKLKGNLIEGELPMLLKQLLLYKISKERGCKYCTFIHKTTADSLSETVCEDDKFNATDDLESSHIPESFRVALKIVPALAANPHDTSDAHFEALYDARFSRTEIQELMAQASLCVMFNMIADIGRIEIDDFFFAQD